MQCVYYQVVKRGVDIFINSFQMRARKITVLLLVFSILGTACTTQKRRGDLSSLGKLYHNTTAKFNGYFNANEIMMASIETLENQHQDNYNNLLDIYKYLNPTSTQAVAGELDEAIKKVSVVVNLHRESVWTDDCYLLIGQAQFLKQDFEGAEQTFRYLINEFRPDKYEKKYGKKRKKGKGRNDRSSGSLDEEDEEREGPKSKREIKREQKVKKKEKTQRAKQKKKEAKVKAKERKRYNKQVKQNRKKRKKGKAVAKVNRPSRKKDEDGANPNITGDLDGEEVVSEVAEVEEAPAEPEEIAPQSISLFGDDEAAIESDPEKYFMKHRPVYQEGLLWLAKALIERDNYDAALRYIGQLENSSGTFEDVRAELVALKAYLYVRRAQYENALAALEQAVDASAKKDNKARYAYISAQLHEQTGNEKGAYEGYQRVLKYGPDYEMAFSAKLAMAENLWLNGGASAEETKSKLNKMLKDIKNIDYQDKIYYALANIALQNGDRAEGIKNLELSLQNSRPNSTQKSEAYFKLAELYFEDNNFVKAKNYYDSTLQVLPKTDLRHGKVKKLSESLTDISKHIQIIELQDSLLRLSELSEEEKKAMAYEIKRKQNEEKRAALTQASKPGSLLPGRRLPTSNPARPGQAGALKKESAFFAYNDRNLKRGKREFERKWGGRQLSDNWRLSSRQTSLQEGVELPPDEEVVAAAITDDDIKSILADVPKDKKEQEVAKLKIKESMFTLGKLYREKLENNEKSSEVLEELNERFPGHNFELDSWYYLYLVYQDLGNSAKKQEYFNKIIAKYPSTNYAKILKDPSYVAELKNEEQRLNQYYDNAYRDFQQGLYKQAFSKSQNAKVEFGASNIFQPRFALLSAMCIGNLQGKEAYIEALKEVVGKYPNTDEQRRAREILRLLGGAVASLPGGQVDGGEASKKFSLEDDKLHYIIVSFDGDVKINDKKNSISDFNKKFYKLEKLRITPLFLGSDPKDRKPMIVIRRFKNKLAAMQYYEGIQANIGEFIKDDEGTPFNIFAVSQNNYRQILRSKSIAGYKNFFDTNYLD